MSLFRRIGLAASAAAAALALAVPTGASAISIDAVASDGTYKVSGVWTWFDMTIPGRDTMGVFCYHDGRRPTTRGFGIAQGEATTPFVPPFSLPDPELGGGCQLQDDEDPNTSGYSGVQVSMTGAWMLTLTGLKAGQNPLASRPYYRGKLWLHSYSSMYFRPAKFPGCTVTIAGPQSVDLDPATSWISVDDDTDSINLGLNAVTFTSTKSAGCPSRLADSVTFHQPFAASWELEGVTVTP